MMPTTMMRRDHDAKTNWTTPATCSDSDSAPRPLYFNVSPRHDASPWLVNHFVIGVSLMKTTFHFSRSFCSSFSFSFSSSSALVDCYCPWLHSGSVFNQGTKRSYNGATKFLLRPLRTTFSAPLLSSIHLSTSNYRSEWLGPLFLLSPSSALILWSIRSCAIFNHR